MHRVPDTLNDLVIPPIIDPSGREPNNNLRGRHGYIGAMVCAKAEGLESKKGIGLSTLKLRTVSWVHISSNGSSLFLRIE